MPVLIPVSLLFGLLVLWVFSRVSNPERIRETKRMLRAHLYELRLFTDEPSLVWRAQLALLRDNFRYFRMSLLPAVVIAAPAFVLFVQLDALYGRAPLRVGDAAIVTAHSTRALYPASPAPELKAPDGIIVETEAVRAVEQREISWRIRPVRDVSGMLRIVLPEGVIEKRVVAGNGPRYISERRVRSWLDLIAEPTESRLPASSIDWVEIRYPAATVSWVGLKFSWIVWLLLFSSIVILIFRRRFGVTF